MKAGDIYADERAAALYDDANYSGLAGWVMRAGHDLVERPFGSSTKFARCIEVGAGAGQHFPSVRHTFDKYEITDTSQPMLNVARQRFGKRADVIIRQSSATLDDVASDSFDRLIACHVLEHLPEPQSVVQSWARVVKPGGVISIVLPCDPGLAWRFGRTLGPRRRALRRGIPYDYVQALEHINSITNLIAIIDHHWPKSRTDHWWPTRFPLSDINLIYATNIRV